MRVVTRRTLLRQASAAGAGFLGLHALGCATELTNLREPHESLIPDPAGLLDLPAGFSYRVIARAGERMDDGLLEPRAHDGMGVFPASAGRVVLVRNHELGGGFEGGPWEGDPRKAGAVPADKLYDAGFGDNPGQGGTTTLVYNLRSRQVERRFLSLTGTYRNCAGGVTPWGSWVSCEEHIAQRGNESQHDHGYCFEVKADPAGGLVDPQPLRAMGRFNHEAIAVDPLSGAVYLTEDRPEGLFYRYLPDEPGQLDRGGRLQALVVSGTHSLDTRNWEGSGFIAPGTRLRTEWVDLQDVESPDGDDLRQRGADRGAARFARGEGIWYADRGIVFACTIGGQARKGQIWRYWPSRYEGAPRETEDPGVLELFLQPDEASLLENPDNITISPHGELLLCEDGPEGDRLVRVNPRGRLRVFARNVRNNSELAGASFSPDGRVLFLNIQTPGLTVAIEGPWT